jgi:hypothetical protein
MVNNPHKWVDDSPQKISTPPVIDSSAEQEEQSSDLPDPHVEEETQGKTIKKVKSRTIYQGISD